MPEANILVIEKDQSIAQVIQRHLEDLGYSVAAMVSTKEQALKTIEKCKPDLVLADVAHLDEAGSAATLELFRSGFDVPLIAISCDFNRTAMEPSKPAELIGVIIKPLAFEELQATIETALRKSDTPPSPRRAEDDQQQADLRYKEFFQNSIEGYFRTTTSGKFIEVNLSLTKTLGYDSPEELMGTLTDLENQLYARPEQRRQLLEILKARGYVKGFEYEVYRKDRTKIWVSQNTRAVHDSTGNVLYLQGTVHNITERKQTEKALRESEERFRLIAETIDEVFWISDVEKEKMLYISPAFERVWGHPLQKLYEDRKAFRDALHPEDRDQTLATLKIQKTGQPYDHEYRIIRPDGSVRQIWDRGFPIQDGIGCVRIYVGVAQDVTTWRNAQKALKESTEYLNQIINCIGDPIFVKDSQQRFVLVNDALCAITNKQRDELLGRTIRDITSPDRAEPFWIQEKSILETGKECIDEEEIIDGHGNLHTIMTRKTALTDKAGNKQIVGIIRDITERKHLEAQLLQAQKMEAIGVLAGGVAHDFNNMLNVINGYSEILLDNLEAEDPRRNDLEQIMQAGQRAASLTSQLLAFSRKQILSPKILNLNDAISDLNKILRRLIGEDIELVCDCNPNLGLINADPGQIQQIVMNLAVNARDAMPLGGRLTIETINVDIDQSIVERESIMPVGQYVMLAISDNGIGMDAETQARIFEPFFTTKGPGKGTGLGLSTVYGIIKQSGGFVWVYSEPRFGTTFKIYLPRVHETAAELEGGEKADHKSKGGETVLVVEDEPLVRSLTARILSERGYKVLEASNGKEALQLVQEFIGKIHLVLTDVVMPEMSGKVLVDRLEAMRPEIRSLFVSGYTNDAILNHGILDSGVAFLQKPFTAESITCKVRELIDMQ